MMKCELHDGLEKTIEEIRFDIKEIKKVLLGNGAPGVIGRISMLELKHQSWGNAISYLLNILQGLVVAYLVFKIKGGL